ncbi:25316_t:CDS:2 [Dentiscutata erythropus]|uniref:25316_t:CDS:1 n=1 Tax=Dentiscutata erythropus TaxID=1348616 RepID=A0A9N9ERM0_9GLOM|nr:25316_t:CDS:2 [Dentiscutata erythropus]
MTYIHTLKRKVTVHSGRVRRSCLLRKKQAKLASNSSQDVSANSNLKESNDNFEDVLTSNDNDLEERNEDIYYCEGNNKDEDFEDNNSLEYNNTDDYLKESSDDFESITFYSDSLESSNNDFEDSTDDCETIEYTVGQFVEFIYINSNSQCKKQFGRIEAIVSFLPHNRLYNQIQTALKMSRLLRHNELEIYCNQERSRRGHKELWMIEENYKIISPSYVLRHISVWIEDVSQPASYDFRIFEILYKDAITKRIQI